MNLQWMGARALCLAQPPACSPSAFSWCHIINITHTKWVRSFLQGSEITCYKITFTSILNPGPALRSQIKAAPSASKCTKSQEAQKQGRCNPGDPAALWETGDHLKPCALAPKNLSSKAAMKNSAEVCAPRFFLQIAQSPQILMHMKAAFQAQTYQREFQNQAKQVQLYW